MDIKTLEQAFKLQKDLTARLTQNQALLAAGKISSIEVLVKAKEQAVVSAQAEADTATKDRDAAIARWDERVAQSRDNVARLQKELDDLRKQLAQRSNPPKQKETGGGKKGASGKKGR